MTLKTDAEIVELLEQYEKDTKALKNEALNMCWYMRGGLSYNDSMALSNHERVMITDIVKNNMETTKKTGLPFF